MMKLFSAQRLFPNYLSAFRFNIFDYLVKTFFITIIIGLNLRAQISPGDLTKAHSNLEGMSNCTKCHVLGEQVTNSKCLDCHSEIQNLIGQGKGYHAYNAVKNKNCFDCHSEHHGRNFKIINFAPNTFDHSKTGYELTGSHANVKCNDCHQSKYINTHISKKKNETYLGLSTECRTCHEDVHQSMLGKNCSSCHTTIKFQAVQNFKHDNARFKLTGSHLKVDCAKCHPLENKNNKKIQKFKDIAFSSCRSCHNDVHKGKFGSDCNSCHSTSSFHNISQGSFNHGKTDFPLIGKHGLTACNDCHKTNLSI